MNEIVYKFCPVCESRVEDWIQVKDHSISHKTFTLSKCTRCSLVFTNPSPDKEHIGNFYKGEDYISHNDNKKGIINYLYHIVRQYTVRSKVSLLNNINSNKSRLLLDIGCGTGYFLQEAQKQNWSVEGVEPDETASDLAKVKVKGTIYNQLNKESTAKYDVISLWHVLEHVHDLNETFEFIKKNLQKNGKVIIAVPNLESHDAKYYKENWAAFDVPRHLYHFSKGSLSVLVQKYDFKISEIKPMLFDSFYVSLISEKYINNGKIGLLSLIKAFFIGLTSNLKGNKNNNSSLIYLIERNDN